MNKYLEFKKIKEIAEALRNDLDYSITQKDEEESIAWIQSEYGLTEKQTKYVFELAIKL